MKPYNKIDLTVESDGSEGESSSADDKSTSTIPRKDRFHYDECTPTSSEEEEEDEKEVIVKKKVSTEKEDSGTSLYNNLSQSQKKALDLVIKERRSVFITGSAGTGKSHLIRTLKWFLNHKEISYHISATTGSASFLLEGTTIHRFGFGMQNGEVKEIVKKTKKYDREKIARWKSLRVLIIDEISMLPPDYFDKLNLYAQEIREIHGIPFGGLQLVLVGDFLQLPPVNKERHPSPLANKYVFQTTSWASLKLQLVKLDTCFRQSEDEEWKKILDGIRIGELTEENCKKLRERSAEASSSSFTSKPLKLPDNLTKLLGRRSRVQEINTNELTKIESPAKFFNGTTTEHGGGRGGRKNNDSLHTDKSTFAVDEFIQLKKGALVILCANLDVNSGLCNGSKGKVIGFTDDKNNTNSDDSDDQEEEEKNDKKKKGKPTHVRCYPIVQFFNGIIMTIEEYTWKIFEGKTHVLSFTQIPLILSYAITIHKCQGLTLDKALVEMNFFENGHAYVALSRVRKLDDLFLSCFSTKDIKADPLVIKYYTVNKLL